ncbi:fatty acid synthase-like [Anoplophora glabripennis]|uniref:fatty acid synthase-like n=1 Tax=Anoplophora glabripennis TaxID=217634 RepID=UPI0008745C8D|nr:fatty acid synthase-like [Anoplophora glabripennis]
METNEEIVISGISGRYPECKNIEELMEALLNGVDLVTDEDTRFPRGVMGIPPRMGKVPELDKFDSTFFGIHAKQAEFLDPRHRILLETVQECIVDAGYNPQELRGSKTGVYAGLGTFTNPEQMREREDTDGYTNIGLCMGMAANRISFCFDFKGKSYTLDNACASSLYCFVNAVEDMRSGKADAVVVCGSQIMFHPGESSEFNKLNMLAPDGKCKVFNTDRDGYARGEAIISLLLQKKSVSRRVYATVAGAMCSADGYKLEGITYPCARTQGELLDGIYNKHGVDPDELTYVEAHGTGTPAGDTEELQAIVTKFCQNRKSPLPVGAVKSNMGHSEVASGLCSVSKVLIAMETGIIPANLHIKSVDTDLPGVRDEKIKVVTENLPWDGGLVAVNSFGFGGANAHVALKSNPREKSRTYKKPKYRLVQVSGRTEEAVNHFLDEVEKNADDEEFLALVDEVHKMNCEGHNYRGYTILGEKPKREVSRYNKAGPIWFIYAGMGSQWIGMGRDLMNNEIFRNTIKRCAVALKPYHVDLEDILTNENPNTFEDFVNCFAAIGAVEIALTDLLYSLGIVPDGIAGHSLGEVGCSYADGHLTAEEAVLLSYARGYASKCVKLPAGAMAAVALSKEDCLKILPDDTYIACQNGKSSVTVSGPEKLIADFAEKLTAQGIFAKKVNTGGLAYHSKYIKDAGPFLYDFVNKIVKTPTLRSPKWLSTSVSEKQKGEPWTRYNCAEYHTNNFCNTVLFDEVYDHIPENAIVVEVAPHGLMQAILKRELSSNVKILPVTNRSSPDNEEFFLSAIGKIYLAGGQPNLKNLYKGVTYPVSRGTKMLSPLVKWDHGVSWMVPVWHHKDSFGQSINVNISNEQHSHLAGHNIDGRVLMPATGYLELAWRTLAQLHLKDPENLPVIAENVIFKRATVLPPRTEVKFLVNLMKQSGHFEIFEGGSVVCTGTIYTVKDVTGAYSDADCPATSTEAYVPLMADDVYKECHLRRYLYEGSFQGLVECDVEGLRGKIKWQDNFTSFLDTMLHMTVISETKRDLLLPTAIEKVVIDPRKHLELVAEQQDLPIFYNQNMNVLRCGGVEIVGMDSSKVARRKHTQEDPLLETYEFLPYETSQSNDIETDANLSAAIQIILQNVSGFIKTLKIFTFPEDNTKLLDKIKQVVNTQPMVELQEIKYDEEDTKTTADVVLLTEPILKNFDVNKATKRLTDTGMILYQGDISKIPLKDVNIVYGAAGIHIIRAYRQMPSKYSVVYVKNSNLDWLEKIKELVQARSKEVVFLVSQGDDTSGVVGLMKCLLTEPNTPKFRCVLIQDEKAPEFSPDSEFYRNQLATDLTFNVLRHGKWGTFVHQPLRPTEKRNVKDATVDTLTIGDLSTLSWVERSPSYVTHHPGSELVYVCYSSLNFKDVMVATGKLCLPQANEPTAPEVTIGFEYAGITGSGKRVMGVVEFEGLSLQVQPDAAFVWDVPREWSLEEAATVPCVYATCYLAMIVRGGMQPGESILIHAGSGGVGIAAIAIALGMGCTVFATVGSQEKRDYLKKLYPQIEDANIGNSRNASFRRVIMERTKGKGVDLVLNSLAGDLFQQSLKCIGSGGRFLEIGKVDFLNRTAIDSNIFYRNCSFHGIDLDEVLKSSNIRIKEAVRDLLIEGIKKGVVKPLPRQIFKEDEIEDAFRLLSSGKHKGKILIELRKETRPIVRTISAVPRMYFDPNKSYVLVGGLGGVGLELAEWLIRRGATKVILNSRRQIHNGYQSYCLKKWSKWNRVTVKINTDDTTALEGARNLVNCAKDLGPVGGIFNMALVLKDGLIENQTAETFDAVFKPKIASGFNMDAVTRLECPELDHFVVFSSAACGRGNFGQSNYGMANSALEQLCYKRRRENLPALAVQWGPIGEVGALMKTQIINKLSDHMVAQNISSCIEALERFMLQDSVVGSSMVLATKEDTKRKETTKTPAEAVAHILGIRNIGLVDKTLTLAQLGLDSLMVAEIKQTLYRNYQLEVSTDEIRDLTFDQLIAISETDQNNNLAPLENGKSEEVHGTITAMLSKETLVALNQTENESRTIFLVHPIQGHVDVLRTIAGQLKATVYGVQCTREADFDSIPDYARYYVKRIKERKPQGPYFLCGYSFGAAVALEMGLQLEKSGEVVQVALLDGSPSYVREHLEELFVKMETSVEKSKTAILVNFVSSFTSLDQDKLSEQLQAVGDWEKQLKYVAELVSKETGLDVDDVAVSANGYYKRFLAGVTYQPKGRFNGRVLLVRGNSDQVLSSEDYDLHEVCHQDVELVKLKGDHNTVLLGENVRLISEKINTFF